MGAWIETGQGRRALGSDKWSHPTWVRGLKLTWSIVSGKNSAVAPYVGAWIETFSFCIDSARRNVAPYVGAWIETTYPIGFVYSLASRTLRGCVD